MTRRGALLLLAAALAIAVAWQQMAAARTGLVLRDLSQPSLPMLYVAPNQARAAPGVLIAHGFSGSRQLMLGYAYTLAHAGYATLLWDFDGHGANPARLREDSLAANIAAARAALVAQPEVDPQRLALLGHSMGSGAVMSAGVADLGYAATVAISPTGADVSPTRPRNLMLQAGSLEGRFVANAERLLEAAGGANDDLAGGAGRTLLVIPAAEHISILFRPQSHRAALSWLDGTFGRQSVSDYVDQRIRWYGLHALGWLLALAAITSRRPEQRLTSTAATQSPARPRQAAGWAGILLGPLLAAAALAALNRVFPVASLGGLMVGGAVSLFFFLAGLVWLGLGGFPQRAWRLRGVLAGLGLFGLLALAFGVMGQAVWLQWWLTPARLGRWPLLALGLLPWFLAAGWRLQGASWKQGLLAWLGQSVALMLGLGLAVALTPALFFLVLLLPLVPLLFAVFTFAGARVQHPAAYAVGCALFFAWLLAAVFPLAG
jgi:dienelactone hydrolase